MKKLLSIFMCLTVILSVLTAYSFNKFSSKEYLLQDYNDLADKNSAVFSNGLKLNYNNECRSKTNICLTEKYFIYTTEDNDNRNSFGEPEKIIFYDLKSGNISAPISDYMTDVYDMYVIDDVLYFTCYKNTSYDVEANWGYCLCAYDFSNNMFTSIFETPNTVDNISVAVLDNNIYYLASLNDNIDDNKSGYILYEYDTSKKFTKIANEEFQFNESDYLISYDKNYIYFEHLDIRYNDCSNYEVNGVYNIKVNERGVVLKDENTPKIINNDNFGNYSVTEKHIRIPGKQNNVDCGYRYKTVYYLNNNATKETFKLSSAYKWHFYF